MVNDTRLSLSTLIIHVYIARPARGAKHLLTTTRTTHDRSTRGNFGLVQTLLDRGAVGDGVEAEAAVERLASAPADEGLVMREIWLLRMRALLAQAMGEEESYRCLLYTSDAADD